jgi:DEAD/DEAH box helicase domain-containing protein
LRLFIDQEYNSNTFTSLSKNINEDGFNDRKSSFTESLDLFNRFVQCGLQTIAFTRARQAVERMYVAARSSLREKVLVIKYPLTGQAISALSGIASDPCIIDGYPGTVMSTRQQAGRAGRGMGESIVALVARANALDPSRY